MTFGGVKSGGAMRFLLACPLHQVLLWLALIFELCNVIHWLHLQTFRKHQSASESMDGRFLRSPLHENA